MLENTVRQTMNVTKRDGRLVSFDFRLITRAIEKAFCAEQGRHDPAELPVDLREQIEGITASVVGQVEDQANTDQGVSVEQIQDIVERELMRAEYYSVARRYILYRAEHNKIRQLRAEERMESGEAFPAIMVNRDGKLEDIDFQRLRDQVEDACDGLQDEPVLPGIARRSRKAVLQRHHPQGNRSLDGAGRPSSNRKRSRLRHGGLPFGAEHHLS